MASRFEKVDNEFIEELKEMSENENTKKSTEYCKNVFKKWATERNVNVNLEEYECEAVDQMLLQFTLQRDDDGTEFLTFDEGLTKTRKDAQSCCLYLEKRPKEMKTSCPFYLSVIDKPVSSIWFKKTPMGKNTISNLIGS